MKLIFVTGNAMKLKETRDILNEHEIISFNLDLEELQGSREEISTKKCQIAFNKIKESGEFPDLDSSLVLIEDSSFYVDEYYPLPGVYVKEFLKLQPTQFLDMFKQSKQRNVSAYCSFGITDGNHVKIIEGCLKGTLAREAKGSEGFGWDPYFIPENFDKTFAEMSPVEKNKISQRRKAAEKLKIALQNDVSLFN